MECKENAQVMFSLYEMPKKKKIGMMNPEMIDDTIQIIMEGIRRRKRMNLIINNRAGGNAPMIAQQIAKKLLEGTNI